MLKKRKYGHTNEQLSQKVASSLPSCDKAVIFHCERLIFDILDSNLLCNQVYDYNRSQIQIKLWPFKVSGNIFSLNENSILLEIFLIYR